MSAPRVFDAAPLVVREGTHRAATLADTWARFSPRMPAAQITRLADLTGLDTLGVPVFIAAIICVAITFGVRILAVLFNWSLPEQKAITTVPRIRRKPRTTKRGSES